MKTIITNHLSYEKQELFDISNESFENAKINEYFSEIIIELSIFLKRPDAKEENQLTPVTEISITHILELKKQTNKQCLIVPVSKEPVINITTQFIKHPTPKNDIIEKNDPIEKIIEETLNHFQNINLQKIQDDAQKKIKAELIFNQKTKDYLQKNIKIHVENLTQAIKTNSWEKVTSANSHIETTEIKKMQQKIKIINSKNAFKKLSDTLPQKEKKTTPIKI